MISSKASSSSYSRSMMLVAGTIRYRLLLATTTHRGITPFSRVALSSHSYSTSSYSCTGGDDDDDVGEEEQKDCEEDDDNYDENDEDEDDGIDEVNLPTVKKRAKWTDDLVR